MTLTTTSQLSCWFKGFPGFSDLLEDDGLLVPDGVDGIALRCLGLKRFPLGVYRETKHVDLHIGAHFLIRQELA